MRHLVTGTTGFIGSRVVDQLLERGDSVVALTRSPDNAADRGSQAPPGHPIEFWDAKTTSDPLYMDGTLHLERMEV